MRIFAIILNAVLLASIAYLLVAKGAPNDASGWWIVALITVTAMVSIVALFLQGGRGWMSLYLQRKALEEQKRIDDLQSRK